MTRWLISSFTIHVHAGCVKKMDDLLDIYTRAYKDEDVMPDCIEVD